MRNKEMTQNIYFRLRGPNIIGSSLFVFVAYFFNLRHQIYFDWEGATLIILSMVLFNVFIWISNDYFDAPFDAADSYKIERNVFCADSSDKYYKLGFSIMIFSLIGGLISGLLASLLLNDISFFVFTIAGMLLAYLYTSPVFRAKSRAIFDWIFHVVWFQITFLPLYLYIFGFDVIWGFETKHFQFYGVFLFISLASLLAQINHQIPDYSIDLKTEQRTTVVVLGVEKTIKIRYLFYFLISAAALALCLLNSAIIALLMIIIYTLYMLKTDRKKAEDAPLLWLYFFVIDYLVITPFLMFIL
jgi:1,4-dihydroxy-2-naphthoate octaprenyltransferase